PAQNGKPDFLLPYRIVPNALQRLSLVEGRHEEHVAEHGEPQLGDDQLQEPEHPHNARGPSNNVLRRKPALPQLVVVVVSRIVFAHVRVGRSVELGAYLPPPRAADSKRARTSRRGNSTMTHTPSGT